VANTIHMAPSSVEGDDENASLIQYRASLEVLACMQVVKFVFTQMGHTQLTVPY
jgi:hypothetical protein